MLGCESVLACLSEHLRVRSATWPQCLWKSEPGNPLKIWKSAVAKLQGFDKHVEGFMCIRVYNNIYIYIYFESVLIAVTVNEKDLYFGRTLFWVFSLVHKIVLFGALPRAKNCALDRAFWCSPSCTKSCFLVLSLVHKIVLFGALPRAKNRALDRLLRATNRAFWCSP